MNKFLYAVFFTILMLNTKIFSLDITGVWEISADTLINEDIHVFPGGEIIPSSSLYSASITINGNLVNEGTIRNNSFRPLSITLSDSLINSGSFNVKSVTLNGTTVQGISTTSTTPIRAENFYINNSITVKALSDLYFMNSRITFQNGGGFDLSNGCDLYINGGHLSGAKVYGPEHYTKSQTKICLYNGAFLLNSELHQVDTDGTLILYSDTIFYGPFSNLGIIKPDSSQKLTVLGDFENAGTITDTFLANTSSMTVSIKGNLKNEGTINNFRLTFDGDSTQYVNSCTTISSTFIRCSNPQGIILGNDLIIDCGNYSGFGIYFENNPINLNGFDLFVKNAELRNANISGPIVNGIPISNVQTYENAGFGIKISGCTFRDVALYGQILTYYSDVTIEGHVFNYGLISNGYYSNIIVNGSLYNLGFSGRITSIVAYVYGSIHNGSDWDNSSIVFCGTGDQFISCDPDKPYSVSTVECTNPNGIKAASDLYFTGSALELTGHSLDLNGYDLNMSGGHLDSAVVLSTDSSARSLFKPSNGSYIKSAIINGVDLDSTLIVQGSNVVLNGPLTNYSTIMNESTGNSEITLNNQFINNGTIQDNGLGYKLITNVKGDITNYGTWNNNYNYFNGENDQVILLPGESEIGGGKTYFVAESDIAPYEWFLNDSTLINNPYFDDTQDKYLLWCGPVSTAYSGIFYCETGEGRSRNIFVYENGLPAPFITGFTIEDGSTKVGIEWDPVDYAVSYKIYSSEDPYKDLSLWQFEAETNLLHHTLWDQTGGRRFYIVKAVY